MNLNSNEQCMNGLQNNQSTLKKKYRTSPTDYPEEPYLPNASKRIGMNLASDFAEYLVSALRDVRYTANQILKNAIRGCSFHFSHFFKTLLPVSLDFPLFTILLPQLNIESLNPLLLYPFSSSNLTFFSQFQNFPNCCPNSNSPYFHLI